MRTLIQTSRGNKEWWVLYASNAVNGLCVRGVMNELKNTERVRARTLYSCDPRACVCVRVRGAKEKKKKEKKEKKNSTLSIFARCDFRRTIYLCDVCEKLSIILN